MIHIKSLKKAVAYLVSKIIFNVIELSRKVVFDINAVNRANFRKVALKGAFGNIEIVVLQFRFQRKIIGNFIKSSTFLSAQFVDD